MLLDPKSPSCCLKFKGEESHPAATQVVKATAGHRGESREVVISSMVACHAEISQAAIKKAYVGEGKCKQVGGLAPGQAVLSDIF